MRHYRINDQSPIKTKRLILTPLNAKQLAELEAQEQDTLLRGAIVEMRQNSAEHYDQALWYTGWQITLKSGGHAVGLLGFHGTVEDRTVELGYNVKQEYRGNGYGEEAVKALCSWAFTSEGIYFISVLADEANAASNHILEKLKFYRVESPVVGQNAWELERPASAWMSIYMSIGVALGLMFGQMLFSNIAIGLAIGIGVGISLGSGLDSQDRANRKRVHAPKKINLPENSETQSKKKTKK